MSERWCSTCGVPANRGRPVMFPDGLAFVGGTVIERHHIVPRSLGGSNRASNLIDLCHRCHVAVHVLYRALGVMR